MQTHFTHNNEIFRTCNVPSPFTHKFLWKQGNFFFCFFVCQQKVAFKPLNVMPKKIKPTSQGNKKVARETHSFSRTTTNSFKVYINWQKQTRKKRKNRQQPTISSWQSWLVAIWIFYLLYVYATTTTTTSHILKWFSTTTDDKFIHFFCLHCLALHCSTLP